MNDKVTGWLAKGIVLGEWVDVKAILRIAYKRGGGDKDYTFSRGRGRSQKTEAPTILENTLK